MRRKDQALDLLYGIRLKCCILGRSFGTTTTLCLGARCW